MILTVTLNSALDRLLFLDEFRPGTTMRPQKMVEAVGGKGFDVSVVLQTLQAENLALGLVAGLTGQQLVKLLDGYGITYDLIWVDGETRIAHVLVETRHHRHSHVIAGGLSVPAEAYRNLLAHGWRNSEDDYRLIVVNLTDEQSQAHIDLDVWSGIASNNWRLHDVLNEQTYERPGEQMNGLGLYVDLPPQKSHIFRFERA